MLVNQTVSLIKKLFTEVPNGILKSVHECTGFPGSLLFTVQTIFTVSLALLHEHFHSTIHACFIQCSHIFFSGHCVQHVSVS